MQQLVFKQLGQGPYVVLLHGLFGQASNLATVAKGLATDFSVIVPDLRNHGQSFHSASMSYQEMAEDVIRLVDSLGISQFFIMGHSMGGKVAMQLAQQWPERVLALVCADIAPVTYPHWHSEILTAMKTVSTAAVTSRQQAEGYLEAGISEKSIRQFLLTNLKRQGQTWQWQLGLEGISGSYPEIVGNSLQDKSCDCAALFIKGELSDYITEDNVAAIKHYFPKASFKIIQGAGHWLHAQKPEVFIGLLRRYLLANLKAA